MTSLMEICKERMMNEMIRPITANSTAWKALIVDQESMRIISGCCKMYDVMEENITVVEKIDIARQPLPDLEAIYFLSPKIESIDLLINDFRKKDKPMYAAAHLFFTSKLGDAEFEKIRTSPAIAKIKTLKELNMEFISYESQVYHFDMGKSLFSFFSPDSTDGAKTQALVANKLVTLMAALNEYPIIRYSKSHALASTLATAVQTRLDSLARTAVGWTPNEDRAILLVLDRTFDPISPLLHEFSYQAMVYDLLDVKNDRFKYNFTSNSGVQQHKEILLGETDPLWPVLRHMHIAEAIEWVTTQFNDFAKANAKMTDRKQASSLADMSEMMRSMPQYTEMLSKYSVHYNLTESAMNVFNGKKIENIASIEQDMACGTDADGNTVKNLISVMPGILADETISMTDKIRLLMIFIISQEGIKDQDRKRLVDLAKMSFKDQKSIENLFYLGVALNKGAKAKKVKKDVKKKKKRGDDVPFTLSRYVPNLKEILEAQAQNQLDASEFPYVRDDPSITSGRSGSVSASKPTSLREGSKQPRWADKDKGKKKEDPKNNFQGARIIVFIAGGMTYSEMRSAYEISQATQRQVIIGSTHILTPADFVEQLASLKSPAASV